MSIVGATAEQVGFDGSKPSPFEAAIGAYDIIAGQFLDKTGLRFNDPAKLPLEEIRQFGTHVCASYGLVVELLLSENGGVKTEKGIKPEKVEPYEQVTILINFAQLAGGQIADRLTEISPTDAIEAPAYSLTDELIEIGDKLQKGSSTRATELGMLATHTLFIDKALRQLFDLDPDPQQHFISLREVHTKLHQLKAEAPPVYDSKIGEFLFAKAKPFIETNLGKAVKVGGSMLGGMLVSKGFSRLFISVTR